MKEKYRDKDWLRKKYVEEEMVGTEIAKMCDVDPVTIYNWLRKFGIKVHHKGKRSNNISLTDELCEFLDGLLLGDGNLSSTRKPSAQFHFVSAHRRYLKYLSSTLESFGIERSGNIYSSDNGYRFATKCYREFKELYKRWYPNGVKRVPDDIRLAPSTVFNWYIGDGTYTPSSGGRLMLCVMRENMRRGLPILKTKLEELGIKCTINSNGIRIRNSHRNNFFDYILSANLEIPSCYEYKFPEKRLANRCQSTA